jgi:hypothetical protein
MLGAATEVIHPSAWKYGELGRYLPWKASSGLAVGYDSQGKQVPKTNRSEPYFQVVLAGSSAKVRFEQSGVT